MGCLLLRYMIREGIPAELLLSGLLQYVKKCILITLGFISHSNRCSKYMSSCKGVDHMVST